MGRLVKHKGAHHLIEAFKKLDMESKISNNFKLVIVGDGFYTDDYVHELKDSARNNENIIFTGSLTGEELNGIFANAGLFVQPSETEGLSISLLEAMSYGVPVLISDIQENLDVAGEVAQSFKTNNVTDLKKKLDKLINGKNNPEIDIEGAKKLIENKYNWEIISQKTISLYIRLLCDKKIKCLAESEQ
ncbi:MAG: Glycosyl transferase group 1 [Candidatus Moranbacteria bacterium GW2011_GWE2_35_164]|nr:MAG: Glycosyl transferase group 1 [Candidatus Moranbacteria bacterium GW2011_GWE2_35_164]